MGSVCGYLAGLTARLVMRRGQGTGLCLMPGPGLGKRSGQIPLSSGSHILQLPGAV